MSFLSKQVDLPDSWILGVHKWPQRLTWHSVRTECCNVNVWSQKFSTKLQQKINNWVKQTEHKAGISHSSQKIKKSFMLKHQKSLKQKNLHTCIERTWSSLSDLSPFKAPEPNSACQIFILKGAAKNLCSRRFFLAWPFRHRAGYNGKEQISVGGG